MFARCHSLLAMGSYIPWLPHLDHYASYTIDAAYHSPLHLLKNSDVLRLLSANYSRSSGRFLVWSLDESFFTLVFVLAGLASFATERFELSLSILFFL